MPLEKFITKTTVLKGHEERMKVGHRGIPSFLDGLYRCYYERFKVTT